MSFQYICSTPDCWPPATVGAVVTALGGVDGHNVEGETIAEHVCPQLFIAAT